MLVATHFPTELITISIKIVIILTTPQRVLYIGVRV